MKFIYKAYLQGLLSLMPRGERLNFLLQKYVTKTLPRDDASFVKEFAVAKEFFGTFTKYAQHTSTESASYYEFGAGQDLINPIGLSLLGMPKLYCIDIRELVCPQLLNDAVSRLYKLRAKIPFDYSLPGNMPSFTVLNYKDVLADYFRIFYEAPVDARHTAFQESMIDFCASNVTFEHISKHDIGEVLSECHRIVQKGGIMSCIIDYKDHWSYFDRSISIYNFLKYSPLQWRKYNPPLHYQNRLRHKDYLDIISQTSFEVLEVNPLMPSDREMDLLKKLHIDAWFHDKYTIEELSIKGSQIVLRK